MRRIPLAVFLAVQALLSFWNLGLLSPWGDEAATLTLIRHSPAYMVQVAAHDVHPPVFYLLLWGWQHLPLGLDPAVQARILTVLFALAATVAADRLLASRLSERGRSWFLALWCVSPCLLLYARMSRSYSMQVLAGVLAVGCLLRCLEKPGRRYVIFTAVALLAAVYTHYLPGLVLTGAANLALLWRRRWRDAVLADAIFAAGLTPWAVWLARSIEAWSRHNEGYAAIGGAAEYGLKAAYWGVSFVAGEAVPDVLLVAGLVLTPVCAVVLWRSRRALPQLFALTAVLAAAGFLGVARWVSYQFVPARLLFLLPLVLALFAAGAAMHPRTGGAAVGALLCISLAGDWCYFHKQGFRNKEYPMPMREIAARMAPGSAVLVDATNSDPAALKYALGPGREVWLTTDPRTPPRLAGDSAGTVWFLRNTHDVSAAGLNARCEAELKRSMRLVSVRGYEPFTPLERRAMGLLGMPAPEYFGELLEFRK